MLEKAVIFAANAHKGQKRKGTSTPYIIHPMEVAVIASGMTDDIEIISAAVLHDVVEIVMDIHLHSSSRNLEKKSRHWLRWNPKIKAEHGWNGSSTRSIS